MFTIGQFSKICAVTAKALRHYEKIGLLRPARVETFNQYRYYSRDQVDVVRNICHMKELGIPLETIKAIIDKGNSPDDLRALLAQHRETLIEELNRCNARLTKLAWWNQALEANVMTNRRDYDIRLRDVPEITVRSVRKQLTNFPETLPPLISGLYEEITAAGACVAGAPIMLYHDKEFNPELVDVEVAWPVTDPNMVNATLPAVRVAACVHVGPYHEMEQAYAALFEWTNRNGYRVESPMREVSCTDPSTTAPEQLVTEIHFPVVKD
ncbi:MerR family transcriptional regulator [Heliobacterium undosum]|uniref:MerR family transcriptional regulator n=1 Tax=Heliomicrobium undosum TaxID=121734 RepID=A0A845L397_9FIRM|nr:MerR family transcriptional regulator [Heliomicrobium undosum]MZP31097.1 MerR family transcriptional regulator [Heliomicrobium undosum]